MHGRGRSLVIVTVIRGGFKCHLCANGVRHLGSESDTSTKLEKTRNDAGAAVGEGAGSDGVGESVGYVVGAD